MKYSVVYPKEKKVVGSSQKAKRGLAWTSDQKEAFDVAKATSGVVVDSARFAALYNSGKTFADAAKASEVAAPPVR